MRKPTYAVGMLVLCGLAAAYILAASIHGGKAVADLTQTYGAKTPSEWSNHLVAREYFHGAGGWAAVVIYCRHFVAIPIALLTIALTTWVWVRGSSRFRIFAFTASLLTIVMLAVMAIGLAGSNEIVEWIVE